jgi:hexosaminidase
MKQLLKLTGCLALAGLFALANRRNGSQLPDHPMPQEIVTAQGNPFILKSGVKILYPEGNEKMQRNAHFLADYLKTATEKISLSKPERSKNAIVLILGTANRKSGILSLKVAGDGITITGPTEAGVFYGIQSCANHCLWLSVQTFPCPL